jgi:hypothetical protein
MQFDFRRYELLRKIERMSEGFSTNTGVTEDIFKKKSSHLISVASNNNMANARRSEVKGKEVCQGLKAVRDKQ